MPTYAGNAATYPTSIYAADDLTTDSAANRGATYQGLADRTAYLKAQATRTDVYYSATSTWQTQADTFTNASDWQGASICLLTIPNVPAGATIVVDGIFSTVYSGSSAMARLEIVEGGTVTPDAFAVPVPTNATTPMPNVNLQGKFTKTGTGSVTIRLAVKGATVYSYTPWSLRAQVIRAV